MLQHYKKILNNWDPSCGPRPTAAQLKEVSENGWARDGSKTAFAFAMLLREDGASQVQIKHALGATYRNRVNQLEEKGEIKLVSRKINGQTFYRVASQSPPADRQSVIEEAHVVA